MTNRSADSVATTVQLIALAIEERHDDIHTCLTLMTDAERTGVLISALVLAAGYVKRCDAANGWDTTDTPDVLHQAALNILADKGATDEQD